MSQAGLRVRREVIENNRS